jgi:hypothetical protein
MCKGAAWGARRDVIDRASFNLAQSIETIVEGGDPEGPRAVRAPGPAAPRSSSTSTTEPATAVALGPSSMTRAWQSSGGRDITMENPSLRPSTPFRERT